MSGREERVHDHLLVAHALHYSSRDGGGINRSSASPILPNSPIVPRPQTRIPFPQSARGTARSSRRACCRELMPMSSTTTSRRSESLAGALAFESMSERLSGVVTTADGSLRAWRARSALVVSLGAIPPSHGTPRPSTARWMERTVSPARAAHRRDLEDRAAVGASLPPTLIHPFRQRRQPRRQCLCRFGSPACTSPDSPARYARHTSRWKSNASQPFSANAGFERSSGAARNQSPLQRSGDLPLQRLAFGCRGDRYTQVRARVRAMSATSTRLSMRPEAIHDGPVKEDRHVCVCTDGGVRGSSFAARGRTSSRA